MLTLILFIAVALVVVALAVGIILRIETRRLIDRVERGLLTDVRNAAAERLEWERSLGGWINQHEPAPPGLLGPPHLTPE